MPRLACPEEAHGTLHVVQRGRERCACFSSAKDSAAYLAALRDCAARAECAVHAYALMGNHVHLLFTSARATGAARLMPMIAAGYARHLATTYGHEDSVWEEAYDASPVHARRHLLACMRYIEKRGLRLRDPSFLVRPSWANFLALPGVAKSGRNLARPSCCKAMRCEAVPSSNPRFP